MVDAISFNSFSVARTCSGICRFHRRTTHAHTELLDQSFLILIDGDELAQIVGPVAPRWLIIL